MRGNNVMGLIFPNRNDEVLPSLTAVRPLASVPFGGRYRIIDFTLSGLVHAGINKVGIVTQSNYQSLMDHIGSGKPWDLSRKNEGVYFLPPFEINKNLYYGRITAIDSIRPFLRNSKEDYVIITDGDHVANIDYTKILKSHAQSKADITVVCKWGKAPKTNNNTLIWFDDSTNKINDMMIGRCPEEKCHYGLGTYLLRKDLLTRLVDVAMSRNQMDFERDIIMGYLDELNIHAYRCPEYVNVIHSTKSFFEANMELFNEEIRTQLIPTDRPIYTKLRDAPPAIYGLNSSVNNSLVADGCVIDGTVRNSILFRDVKVAEGAVIENSIVMQGAIICEDAKLNYTVLDKDVVVRVERELQGAKEYPMFINKGSVV